jgi:catechol 2,3-dioxygenase-like lactoylglutathione lyase family enzyme
MLSDKILKAFVPTVQPDRARQFYKDTLGLKLLSEDKYGLEFDANGTLLRIIIVEKLTPQPFTVLGWNLDDIISKIKLLNKKGVIFEKYDFFEQDPLGIWIAPGGDKVAWFKDPDGNLLSLTEELKL